MALERARIQIERLPGLILVRVAGVIDEHFDKAVIQQALAEAAEPVLVDIDGVPRITSFGVRELVAALRSVGAAAPIFFCGCRPALMAQFNSFAQLAARGDIVTLYCPYVCADCDHAFEVLTDVRKAGDDLRSFRAPAVACPSFGRGPAGLEDLEASYFAVLADRPLPSPVPPALEEVLDGKPTTARPLRVFKDVSGDVTGMWLVGRLDERARLKRHADGLEGDTVLVLSGLTGADAAGIVRLRDVLAAEGARVYLARVPLDVARALAAGAPASLGRAAMLDVDGVSDARTDAGLAALPWAEAPAGIAAYLAARPTLDSANVGVELHNTPTGKLPVADVARIGKYEIVRRIGMGGMAEVLLGRHLGVEGFEKKVVIKRILPHLALQPSFVQQFLEEARVAARLTHPNIVQIFDLGRDEDNYFIVMEHVNGHDFNALIRMAASVGEPVPLPVVARILSCVCAGLHAAHAYEDDDGIVKPVLHRDVSPHNILIGFDGSVKITDFGVAKASGSMSHTGSGSGTLKGKVPYMAPEHVLGHASDARIDVYAAGLCMYYGLTLHQPFSRSNEVSSLRAVLEAEIPAPRTLRPEIPAELDRIALRAIDRDPERRYASAALMANDLDSWLMAQPRGGIAHVAEWLRALVESAARLPRQEPGSEASSAAAAPGDETIITTPGRAPHNGKGAP